VKEDKTRFYFQGAAYLCFYVGGGRGLLPCSKNIDENVAPSEKKKKNSVGVLLAN